jgi:hypothetical protein
MQMVRRQVVAAIAFSFVVLALLSSGASGRTATDPSADVVVINSALLPEEERSGSAQYGYADYGLVLRNRSSSRDAVNVIVEVEAVDDDDEPVAEDYSLVTVIPAGASFVISGALIWRDARELAGIETEVRVGSTPARRRKLPPVRNVSLTSSGGVTGSFTNPYKKSLPTGATIYGVAFDSRGRIVATGYDLTDGVTRPRATATFNLRGNSALVQRDVATSAKVSVDPCGYFALTRACPVPGAQS